MADMTAQKAQLLTIPIELREIIYDFFFDPFATIKIEVAPQREYEHGPVTDAGSTSWPADFESWAIGDHPHSSQLLRVCSQIRDEALPLLYSMRCFNLTARDSFKLLLHNTGPAVFSNIRQITVEWDAIEELARSLNKPEFQRGMSGLRCIETASWRIRHLEGTSMQWRNVKSAERSINQAACDITEKHPSLKLVAEHYFRSKHSIPSTSVSQQVTSNRKVKWRFITDQNNLKEDEIILDVRKILHILKATPEEASDGGFSLPIDPF